MKLTRQATCDEGGLNGANPAETSVDVFKSLTELHPS